MTANKAELPLDAAWRGVNACSSVTVIEKAMGHKRVFVSAKRKQRKTLSAKTGNNCPRIVAESEVKYNVIGSVYTVNIAETIIRVVKNS